MSCSANSVWYILMSHCRSSRVSAIRCATGRTESTVEQQLDNHIFTKAFCPVLTECFLLTIWKHCLTTRWVIKKKLSFFLYINPIKLSTDQNIYTWNIARLNCVLLLNLFWVLSTSDLSPAGSHCPWVPLFKALCVAIENRCSSVL